MTFIGISASGHDRATLSLKSAQLSPRTLGTDATGARIALVSTTALLLGGDHVEIGIDVGPGCWLELVDTAGTVAYDAHGAPSSWTICITVADGGRLLWKAEPLVVATGSNVARRSTIDLAATGIACLRETLVLGRTGERGGSLVSQTRVRHDGRPLLVEDLDLSDVGSRQRPGIIGAHRVVDTASLLGRAAAPEPHDVGARLFQLAGKGTVARFLGADLHRSSIPAIFAGWRELLRAEEGERLGDTAVMGRTIGGSPTSDPAAQ